MNTAARCSHFLTTTSSSDTDFLSALNTPHPANIIWFTPNDCNNGHDQCSSSSGIVGGDSYLSTLVPHILSSSEFTSTTATLLILYDEGYTQCSSNTGGTGERLYASFSGPSAKKGVQISPAGASHYSYLSTIEAAWGLSSLNSNDAGAPTMLGAFAACTSNCPLTTKAPPGAFLGISNNIWLIIIAGLIGLVASLTLLKIRARAKLKRTKQTMNRK